MLNDPTYIRIVRLTESEDTVVVTRAWRERSCFLVNTEFCSYQVKNPEDWLCCNVNTQNTAKLYT